MRTEREGWKGEGERAEVASMARNFGIIEPTATSRQKLPLRN